MSEEIKEMQETVTVDSAETTTVGEQPEESPENKVASKADVDACTQAIRELTKVVAENTKENVKWFRAGKMGGPA